MLRFMVSSFFVSPLGHLVADASLGEDVSWFFSVAAQLAADSNQISLKRESVRPDLKVPLQ